MKIAIFRFYYYRTTTVHQKFPDRPHFSLENENFRNFYSLSTISIPFPTFCRILSQDTQIFDRDTNCHLSSKNRVKTGRGENGYHNQ